MAATSEVIIRHLLLPGHIDCCLKPITEWIADHLPETPFNLMFQYTPFSQAQDDPSLNRSIDAEEEKAARDIIRSLKLNTTQWNRPIKTAKKADKTGSGEINTTITIRPDGKIAIMHLHRELLDLVKALESGG
jgi:hypothetical protein